MSTRVALYTPSLRGGGSERVMLNLAHAIAGRRIGVDLVLAAAEGALVEQVRPPVRLVDLGAGRVLRSLPRLRRYLRETRPAGLLSTMTHSNVVALLARRLSGAPTRVVVRETNTSVRAGGSRSAGQRVVALLAPRVYPWADAVIAVSEGVARDTVRRCRLAREAVRVIYNPVIRPELAELAAAPLEHSWFAPQEPPVILAAGRLTAQKDYPTLLRAFAAVRRECPARLVILGDGELREELEALAGELGIADEVDLPGFADNPYRYMARAAVFVLSSAWEGLPNALIEAMGVGTPVVATDCESGPQEILAGGRYGKLAPVGDVPALAQAIGDVLLRRDVPMPDAAAMTRFSLPSSTDAYLEALLGTGA